MGLGYAVFSFAVGQPALDIARLRGDHMELHTSSFQGGVSLDKGPEFGIRTWRCRRWDLGMKTLLVSVRTRHDCGGASSSGSSSSSSNSSNSSTSSTSSSSSSNSGSIALPTSRTQSGRLTMRQT